MSAHRIAALWIPDFPVWAQYSSDLHSDGPHSDGTYSHGQSSDGQSSDGQSSDGQSSYRADPRRQPIIIGGIPPERGTAQAVSAPARRLGVTIGMTLAQAQALVPEACFFRTDEPLVRRELVALTELLHTLVPKVERAADTDGLFHLDLRGLERLYQGERDLAHKLRTAVLARHYPAAVGVASTKSVAAIAARTAPKGEHIQVVATGDEARFLAPLPIAQLPLSDRLCDELRALGITTIGAWAALPAAAVATRFGGHGRAMHDLARGVGDTPLQPTTDPEELAVRRTLDEPIADLGLLAFYLKRAVETLCMRLTQRGLKTTALHLELKLDDHDHAQATRAARFTSPTANPRLLLDCLRIDLQREQLSAPVVGFTLRAVETTVAHAEQPSLFAHDGANHAMTTQATRAADDPGPLEQALARIRAMVGDSGVVSPRLADTHRPEEQICWQPWQGPKPVRPQKQRSRRAAHKKQLQQPLPRLPPVNPDAEPAPGPALRTLPVRMLPQPQQVEIQTHRTLPVFFACEHQRGQVVAADGPHRIEGGWWGKSYARDYYTIRLQEGSFWVFREEGEWYLQGVFD